MAQLRAKQIKLAAAGDLLVGGTGGNGEVLAIGGNGTALKVVGGALQYAGFAASEITFASAGDLAATNVGGALDELNTKIADGSADVSSLLAEVDSIEASVGLNADGTLAAFATGGYAEGKTTFKAAVEAIDAALKAEEAARAAADTTLQGNIDTVAGDLADEVARATAEEAAIRVDFAAADAVVAQDAADALAAAIATEVTARDAAILVEKNRAEAVEADLQDQIDAITGLAALNFKGTLAGNILAENLPVAAAGDVYRIITAGAADFAGTGLEVNVGDFVAYTGTVWVKFDNTDPSFTAGNAITLTGNAHDGYTIAVDNGALNFADLADVDTVAAGFLKWDGTKVTFVAPAIADITGLQTALDALDARLDVLEAKPEVAFGSDEFAGNVAFDLAHAPVAGSVVASVNGLVVKPSLVTVTGSTVTFGALGYTLDAGDEVAFTYSYEVTVA